VLKETNNSLRSADSTLKTVKLVMSYTIKYSTKLDNLECEEIADVIEENNLDDGVGDDYEYESGKLFNCYEYESGKLFNCDRKFYMLLIEKLKDESNDYFDDSLAEKMKDALTDFDDDDDYLHFDLDLWR
jgi:predicted house-cleaning noncanonical NTP pyrophosphatase (MazG superfamily)